MGEEHTSAGGRSPQTMVKKFGKNPPQNVEKKWGLEIVGFFAQEFWRNNFKQSDFAMFGN